MGTTSDVIATVVSVGGTFASIVGDVWNSVADSRNDIGLRIAGGALLAGTAGLGGLIVYSVYAAALGVRNSIIKHQMKDSIEQITSMQPNEYSFERNRRTAQIWMSLPLDDCPKRNADHYWLVVSQPVSKDSGIVAEAALVAGKDRLQTTMIYTGKTMVPITQTVTDYSVIQETSETGFKDIPNPWRSKAVKILEALKQRYPKP